MCLQSVDETSEGLCPQRQVLARRSWGCRVSTWRAARPCWHGCNGLSAVTSIPHYLLIGLLPTRPTPSPSRPQYALPFHCHLSSALLHTPCPPPPQPTPLRPAFARMRAPPPPPSSGSQGTMHNSVFNQGFHLAIPVAGQKSV